MEVQKGEKPSLLPPALTERYFFFTLTFIIFFEKYRPPIHPLGNN